MKRSVLETLVRERRAPLGAGVGPRLWRRAAIDPLKDDSALGQAARAAARADVSGEAEIEGRTWFLEVHNPPLELVLVGAVHIAQPLAAMAALSGYECG